MHVTKEINQPRAKSYTSIYDFYGSKHFNDVLYTKTKIPSKNLSVFQATCGDTERAKLTSNSTHPGPTLYVTSEQYHLLNRDTSYRSVVRSTSTFFYDLDDIAKRHSYHTLEEINSSNVNLLKVMQIPLSTNGFTGKSDAIVQECATQIKPNLLPKDSLKTHAKKVKRNFPSDAILSSEIFLRDDVYSDRKRQYKNREKTDRQQKFWSYAKYRTEYTKPIKEEKKNKKKDRGKRTEDPCPCQLFSYACPCTDKKSLTELAKNSKSLTTAEQITSTSKFQTDVTKETKNKEYKSKVVSTKENKLSYTDNNDVVLEKHENIPIQNETIIVATNKNDIPTLVQKGQRESTFSKGKKKSKKRRKITCPKCKENVDILLSTTDEESMKCENYFTYRDKSQHNSKTNEYRNLSEDICNHQPRCELVPVCQILPTDNIYFSHKCIRRQFGAKSPKIRITKACRHHPPCTVVPSCQRANVLKNNCEYIPPCLHRPRCVNLPLCVPASKTFNYEQLLKNEEDEITECPHIPRCKYYPECQYETIESNTENQINFLSQVQNECGYLNDINKSCIHASKGTINQSNPNNVAVPNCGCDKFNKSCQFGCTDCNCNSECFGNNSTSSEAVIFIRDVGCQFRNKKCSPRESNQSKNSSASFDFNDKKINHYYTNVHTLRYEDKFTNPVEEDFSETSFSVTSLEINSQCPAHGEKYTRRQVNKTSGFVPKINTSPYIAYTAQTAPMSPNMYARDNKESSDVRALGHINGSATFPVKSRRSFLKGKYKKMFSVKRRRKSKASRHGFINFSTLMPACV